MIDKRKIILSLVFSLLLIACNHNQDTANVPGLDGVKNHSPTSYSVWATYWDAQKLTKEVEDIKDDIQNICYFAAYFDQNKEVFIPHQTLDTLGKFKDFHHRFGHQSYLTFVNDLILSEGGSSLKDVDLLYTLFETGESMDKHIEDILSLVIDRGFDGIEIDYEAIKGDMELWDLYSQFLKGLWESAKKKNIPMRVVLEPNAPWDSIALPQGPEYVLMCYNLHGHGTKAGPKANEEFIKDLIDRSRSLPGQVNFALATGGFDFQDDGLVSSLTEREAEELFALYGDNLYRDKKSQALVFAYRDQDGIDHEVWYADGETLKFWIENINRQGSYNISIWRLGGNVSLNAL